MFSCEFFEFSKNTYFEDHMRMAAYISYQVQNLAQTLLLAEACSFVTGLFIVWSKRNIKTFFI